MTLRVVLAPRALESQQGLLNRRIAEQVDQYITGLAIDPEEQGWPLVGELKGYRCLRPPSGWFRIVYRVGARGGRGGAGVGGADPFGWRAGRARPSADAV